MDGDEEALLAGCWKLADTHLTRMQIVDAKQCQVKAESQWRGTANGMAYGGQAIIIWTMMGHVEVERRL